MQNFVSRMKNVASLQKNNEENGDIVQTIIIIGIFVVICVVVGIMLTNAISSQASTVSACISDASGAAHGSGNCSMYK